MRVKGSYLQAQFHRVRARRGAKKAILAVAASMLTAAWHMLRNQTDWRELGAAHFERADPKKTVNRLLKRLRQLGFNAELVPACAVRFILEPPSCPAPVPTPPHLGTNAIAESDPPCDVAGRIRT